eukprot:TRINITY_DN1743_c0_g1_i14.p1 TRINITY_DN1743_c0_g1~~TRINITY_DN1743_c0_g1_i14.p1  ORF type:complete len:310 (-),score=60.56 TRINITY_DN1743_c0_g1_i14:49-978(-)
MCIRDSLYTSDLDVIVNDQALMFIPIDDKIINRGVGVQESLSIKRNKIYQLTEHIQRLKKSCRLANINLPVTDEVLVQKVKETVAYAFKTHTIPPDYLTNLRIIITGGAGNFGIHPNVSGTFYVIVSKGRSLQGTTYLEASSEFTIPEVPPKPNLLAQMKSTNYMLNYLVAAKAKEYGGFWGVFVDSEDHLLETSIANLGIIDNENNFVIPPFETSLAGTTLMKCLDYVKTSLVPKGTIKNVVQRRIKRAEVYSNTKELLFFGGEKVVPVVNLDGRKVGSGVKGPICDILQAIVEEGFEEGETFDEYMK